MQVLCVDIDILLLLLIRSQLPPRRRSREPKTAPAAYRFTVAATAVAYIAGRSRLYCVSQRKCQPTDGRRLCRISRYPLEHNNGDRV